jgi:hypothetical protein
MESSVMTTADADWVRLNVLPALWRDEAEDLRTCLCQAPPSDWLGDVAEPEARLWDRDGMPIAEDRRLVVLWLADRVCKRRKAKSA